MNICGANDVAKLIGAPPGYVGYDDNGGFLKKIKIKPYSVVLFDEIEKAHIDVINILLQVLEDGRLTDNFGRVVSFKNTVIIMTSNIGGETLVNRKRLGFNTLDDNMQSNLKKDVLKEAQEYFKPEFLNRIDEIIVFQKLNLNEMKKVINIMLTNISIRLRKKDIEVDFDSNVDELILSKLQDDNMGARPIRRLIQSIIEDKIVDEYIDGNIREGIKIKVLEENGKIITSNIN